MACSYIRHLAS